MKLLSSPRPRACSSIHQSPYRRLLLPSSPSTAISSIRLASSDSRSNPNSNSASAPSSSSPPTPPSTPTSPLPNTFPPSTPSFLQDPSLSPASRAIQSVASSPTPGAVAYNLASQFVDTSSSRSPFSAFLSGRPAVVPRQKGNPAQSIVEETFKELRKRQGGIEAMVSRKWEVGDVYTPHDLSPVEMSKWKKRRRPERDVMDLLGIHPVDEWKNPKLLAEYMTSMGRIKHSNLTGLRPVNQRRVAKAIRRAVGMGFLPSTTAHPELLRRERTGYTYR